jgi:2-polyprenyl-3-methyl-5-hydroxy-6-metoxy-1,4-benzoquinol methylase
MSRGCQNVYDLEGNVVFDGLWDARDIFSTISSRGYDWAGKRVLDIGANTFGLSLEIARHGARVVALEPGLKNSNQAAALPLVRSMIEREGLEIEIHGASIFDAHSFGTFDTVLALGLIYHFRYPQYMLDYLSTVQTRDLFISSQTIEGKQLALVNRRDPSALPRTFAQGSTILKGYHPTHSMLIKMMESSGFSEITSLTDTQHNFPEKPAKGLTNSAYYQAVRTCEMNLGQCLSDFT